MESRFRGLRFAAGVLKILAWIVLVVGVVLFLLAIAGMTLGDAIGLAIGAGPAPATVLSSIVGLILTLVYFAFLYGGAELIYLLLAIEQHTRRLAEQLSERDRER